MTTTMPVLAEAECSSTTWPDVALIALLAFLCCFLLWVAVRLWVGLWGGRK